MYISTKRSTLLWTRWATRPLVFTQGTYSFCIHARRITDSPHELRNHILNESLGLMASQKRKERKEKHIRYEIIFLLKTSKFLPVNLKAWIIKNLAPIKKERGIYMEKIEQSMRLRNKIMLGVIARKAPCFNGPSRWWGDNQTDQASNNVPGYCEIENVTFIATFTLEVSKYQYEQYFEFWHGW